MLIKYRPLNKASEEIRLLELQPAPDMSSALRFKIVHISLPQAKYKALSYVWGDPLMREHIEVEYECVDPSTGYSSTDVVVTTIGANLACALRYLREKDAVLTIWADAICIDQVDDDEKSAQIQKMKRIFEGAVEVLVWLGPAADDSDKAMDAIGEIGEELIGFDFSLSLPKYTLLKRCEEVLRSRIWDDENPTDDQGKSLSSFLQKISGHPLDRLKRALPVRAMGALWNRPWWSRVWVLQEFFVASEVSFACGARRVGGVPFCAGTVAYYWYHSHLTMLVQRWHYEATEFERQVINITVPLLVHWMAGACGSTNFKTNTDLFGVILTAHYRGRIKASDPRDRIYGLLGLVTDTISLKPNYRKSTKEVYTEAMVTFFNDLGLLPLSYCEQRQRREEIPSWVIDWTARIGNPLTEQLKQKNSEFGASGSSEPSFNCFIDGTNDANLIMTLCGAKVTSITHTSCSFYESRKGSVESCAKVYTKRFLQANGLDDETWKKFYKPYIVLKDWLTTLKDVLVKYINSPEDISAICFDIMTVEGRSHWIPDTDDVEEYRIMISLLERGASVKALMKYPRGRIGFSSFFQALELIAGYKRIFATSTGHFGYAPEATEEGDTLVIFFGVGVPFVLRPVEDGQYRLIGGAYVSGIMHGEFLGGDYVQETFHLR